MPKFAQFITSILSKNVILWRCLYREKNLKMKVVTTATTLTVPWSGLRRRQKYLKLCAYTYCDTVLYKQWVFLFAVWHYHAVVHMVKTRAFISLCLEPAYKHGTPPHADAVSPDLQKFLLHGGRVKWFTVMAWFIRFSPWAVLWYTMSIFEKKAPK